MANLQVKIDQVNQDQGYNIYSAVVETRFDSKSELYRGCIKEYGRCIGSCYIDKDGKAVRIGWVFLKREKYDDCAETFLCETWVSIYKEAPRTVRVEVFEELDSR